MAINIECPVDFVSVNEGKIRLTAFSVMLLALAFIIFPSKWIALFLVFDFFLRAFNFGKYSPLHLLSDAEVKLFSIKNKPTDIAPKRFAARIGLVFTVLILLLNLLSQTTASIYFAGGSCCFCFS